MNKNAYTLITTLGTGMYKQEGYVPITYIFKDGKTKKTPLFLYALLNSGFKNIKKVIVVGTRTSSWDVLFGDDSPDTDTWLEIKDACESGEGISDEILSDLQISTSKKLGLPVVLKAHTPKLDYDTTQEVFNVYKTLSGEIAEDTDILFDITHGFRSIPVLIYQTLQFTDIGNPRRVELMYAELNYTDRTGEVRDLSAFWELTDINFAINEFVTKLDGNRIGFYLEPYWEKGTKCILKLTEIISSNYALQIEDVLRQINNALIDFTTKTQEGRISIPSWVDDVRKFLALFYERIYDPSVVKILQNFSLYLEEKNMITQSVIALQIMIETAIAVQFGGEEYIGDYDWWQETGKEFYKTERKKIPNFHAKNLFEIEKLRNQIAHGGAKDKKSKKAPHTASIKKTVEKGRKAADEFIKMLGGK